MFIFILTYQKPLEEVEKYLDAHRTYLDKYYQLHKFIASGKRNLRIGGVIICNVKHKDEAQNLLQEDPFYRHKIATYELIEFEPSKYAPGFAQYL